jgi:hypothetical protein
VCDEFSAVDGGFPTLLNFHRKSAGYEPDRSTLAVSTNYVESEGGLLSEYVAGGRDFDGVAAISFAFPDGHTERAIVGQNGLWSMVYLPERDLSAQGPPIEVTVEYTDAVGGGSETFVLRWGLDTCAQLNHGC